MRRPIVVGARPRGPVVTMVSGSSIDSDIGTGGGAGRGAQSGAGLDNNTMTNYPVYNPGAVMHCLVIAYH